MPHTKTCAFALMAAVIVALPATAQQGPSARPPAAIAKDILDLGTACREAGGKPGRSPGMIQIADLTGDGLPDFVLDLNTYNCEGAASAVGAGQSGATISIYVGGPGATARKVFDTAAFSAKVRGAPRQRVWLDVQGADCGQADAASVATANLKACSRPLNWSPARGTFAYAPLREARPFGAQGPRGAKA